MDIPAARHAPPLMKRVWEIFCFPEVFLTAAPHAQPPSLHALYEHNPDEHGPLGVLRVFLLPLQELCPSKVTWSPTVSAARCKPCRNLVGPQMQAADIFDCRQAVSPPLDQLQPTLVHVPSPGRSSSKTGRECCLLCTPADPMPRESENGLLLSSICILTFQYLVWMWRGCQGQALGVLAADAGFH